MTHCPIGDRLISSWVIVRRIDLNDKLDGNEDPVLMTLHKSVNIQDINEALRKYLNIGLNEKEIVFKLRTYEGHLIPLTSVCKENSRKKPYILEVVKIHQNFGCHSYKDLSTVEKDIIEESLKDIERRVRELELLSQDYWDRYSFVIESHIYVLSSKIHFLDRRLDELTPPEWKLQLENIK